MARKTKKNNIHDFTKQIHSTKRQGGSNFYSNMNNWNEKEAKEQDKIVCHDCRYFLLNCSNYIGQYHKPCIEFEWW